MDIGISIYLAKSVILITFGVIFANIVLESNQMKRLLPLIEPLCRASNLSRESILALFTSFFNPTAGKSTLAGFYHAGKVSDDEAVVTVVMSTFPIVAGESLFRVQAPIAFVLLGPFIGGIYIALNLLSAFIQSFTALLYSKFRYKQHSEHSVAGGINIPNGNGDTSMREIVINALRKTFTALKKIIPIMVASFLAIDVLLKFGVMDYISLFFDPVLRVLGLPGECITVLLADLAHFSAGYATVAALLSNGVITAKQAIITLITGSILIIFMIYLKYSISMYVSLFGRLGVKISIVNLACSIISKLIMIMLVMALM
ncbi:MAG: hypothetical protein OCU20_08150 [Methanophagales archaeon]|nr:hypothetical protein [Methanophagales archaeon]MCW3136982.1 hypothetical protein [Methanophagales archaeon]MCW3140090.1 hypothetical protein [Methanophagales archaeon]MCW7070278.1 hypothetical protein [Methanophagales archaeon]MCW7073828.1 hypothetical protein [Methanophagales archaeon]